MEYKGVVPQAELLVKQKELEAEANELISKGGKVSPQSLFIHCWKFLIVIFFGCCSLYKVYADILPYEEASLLCGGTLPDYIPKVFVSIIFFLDLQ